MSMKREIITIGGNGEIHIPTTSVWMSACEIADLFGAMIVCYTVGRQHN